MATAIVCSILPDGSKFEDYQDVEVPGLEGNTLTHVEAVAGRVLVFAWRSGSWPWYYPEDEAQAFTAKGGVYTPREKATKAVALEGEAVGGWNPATQAWLLLTQRR